MIRPEFAIVGGGVAGATIARELAEAGRKVMLFEAGPWIDRGDAVARYRDSVARDLLAPYPEECRPSVIGADAPLYLKAAGGTSWLWTGITPRFLPEDFEIASRFGVGRDWPFGYRELEPWYLAAERRLGVAGGHTFGSPRSATYPLPPVPMSHADQVLAKRLRTFGIRVFSAPAARATDDRAGRPLCCGSNTCAPICPSGAQYSADRDLRAAERAGCRIVTGATVVRLEAKQDGRIHALRFRRPDGVTHRVFPDHVVLCANAIETPRLLLASGLCPGCRALGRGLMDHLLFLVGFLAAEDLYAGRGPQTTALIDHGRSGRFRSRHAAAKLFLSNALNIQREADALLADPAMWPRLLPELRARARHWAAIGGEIETLPDDANAVTLGDRPDASGLPEVRLRFRPGAYADAGLRHWRKTVKGWVRRIGGGRIDVTVRLSSNHPAGTCRMGKDPADSVVDPDLRAHAHPNLYLAGSSVFPSIGTANPTLTIAALSLRLARRLRALRRHPSGDGKSG
ncbi:MAG: GMC family oxidoreductase [Mariprofundaceae bacterium]